MNVIKQKPYFMHPNTMLWFLLSFLRFISDTVQMWTIIHTWHTPPKTHAPELATEFGGHHQPGVLCLPCLLFHVLLLWLQWSGFTKHYKGREYIEKLIKIQNKEIAKSYSRIPRNQNGKNGEWAECSGVYTTLGKMCELVTIGIVKTAHWKKWPHLYDFLGTYNVREQVKSVTELAGCVINLQRWGPGIWHSNHFDKYTWGDSEN